MSSCNCLDQTSPNPENTAFLPVVTHFLLLCNCIGVIYRACAHADYPMVAFVVFAYLASLSLERCQAAFTELPCDERSRRRDALKLAIWFLYSAITLGFVVQLAPLFPTRAYGASLYAVAIACSSAMFYLYMVWDESTQSSGSKKSCGEKRKRFSECDFPFPVWKMATEKKVHHHKYDSILEKRERERDGAPEGAIQRRRVRFRRRRVRFRHGSTVCRDVGNNHLVGTIRELIRYEGSFPALRNLYLNNNFLTGGVPSQLANLTNMEILHLSHNKMSGVIPFGLAHIPRLTYLYLDHNQFTGRIPDAFYKHPFLKEMYIEGNPFRPGVKSIGIHKVLEVSDPEFQF